MEEEVAITWQKLNKEINIYTIYLSTFIYAHAKMGVGTCMCVHVYSICALYIKSFVQHFVRVNIFMLSLNICIL